VRFTVLVAVLAQLGLCRLAGRRSYERGERYVGAVGDLRSRRDGGAATVHGSEPYAVRLAWLAGGLTGGCSCPFGQDGEFCKHRVAVGLVPLATADEPVEHEKSAT
jgi:uncharacterized Zn finger protein